MGMDACGDILVGVQLTDEDMTQLREKVVLNTTRYDDEAAQLEAILERRNLRANTRFDGDDEDTFIGERVLHMDWDYNLRPISATDWNRATRSCAEVQRDFMARMEQFINAYDEGNDEQDKLDNRVYKALYYLLLKRQFIRVSYAYLW